MQDSEAMRLRTRELQQKLADELKGRQDSCPHKAGCHFLSCKCDESHTSIVWHKLRDIWFGICTNCGKHFSGSDPEFMLESFSERTESDDGVWKPVTKEEFEEGVKDQFNKLNDDYDLSVGSYGIIGIPERKPDVCSGCF